jgi:hypothetical protein
MAGKPFFVRPLPFTINLAGNERAANPAAHLAEFQFPAMTWRTDGTLGSFVVIDLGSATTVDFVALLATNAGSSTTMRVSMDNNAATVGGGSAAYIQGAALINDPATSGRATYHGFYPLTSAQTYRYMAVFIESFSGDFEASTLVVGRKVTSAKYYETQWEAGPLDLSTVTENRNGIPDIAGGMMMRQLSFNLGWMTEAEFETSISPLLLACGKTEPVYCCFDPEPTTYRQNRTYFGRLSESRTVKQGFNRFQREFTIRSFI